MPYPLDLEALVYDHLCEVDHLIFDDQQDLGDEDGDVILGKMLPRSGRILITSQLKESRSLGRYRFTVAHEIGHWVLHRQLFLNSSEQTDLFGSALPSEMLSLNRNVFPKGARSQGVPPEEWQANRFAALVLVNESVLREAFTERFGSAPIACRDGKVIRAVSIRALSRSIASASGKGERPLRDLFGLSTEAMAIALEMRGYVVVEAPVL